MDIEIFKPGNFTASNGQRIAFSRDDLTAIADGYRPDLHDAPAVVGHPRHDLPAYGWVTGLRFEDDRLVATLDKVDPAFAELVKAGRFKRISASFYAPDAEANPMPGSYYLRHVGFLGAQPPAVQGLRPVEFAADEAGALDFTQQETKDVSKDDAAADAKAADDKQRADFAEARKAHDRAVAQFRRDRAGAQVDDLVKAGKVTPGQKTGLVAFMAGLPEDGQTIDFGEVEEAEKVSPRAFFDAFLEALPKQVDFSERAAPEDKDQASVEFAAPTGYQADPDQLDLHRRALAHQREHQTSYSEAVLAVSRS